MNRSILWAEDNEDDVAMIKIAFNRATLPCSLHLVSDGQEAIEWLQGTGPYSVRESFPIPSVICVDIKMPKKTGFEVLQFVRSNVEIAKVPVIVVSSSDEPKDVKRAYELGATSYFLKTPRYEDVIHFIRTLTMLH